MAAGFAQAQLASEAALTRARGDVCAQVTLSWRGSGSLSARRMSLENVRSGNFPHIFIPTPTDAPANLNAFLVAFMYFTIDSRTCNVLFLGN